MDVSVLQILANAVAVSLDAASTRDDRQRALQVIHTHTHTHTERERERETEHRRKTEVKNLFSC
jgi:hypothetical protein